VQSRQPQPALEVTIRFLQPMWREVGYLSAVDNVSKSEAGTSFRAVPELVAGGVKYQSWQEATEREITVPYTELDSSEPKRISAPFGFPASRTVEPLGGEESGLQPAIVRRQESIEGLIEVETVRVAEGIFKITVRIFNRTPVSAAECQDPDTVLMRTFASTHTILHATGGEFISLLEPTAEAGPLTSQCKNIGTWPVLVGVQEQGERDTMLSSPIILYDYPQVAPESGGSFFDGTEIDEMLTLRVLTMTDSEKLEMRNIDEHARRILERAEGTGASDLLKMHGTMREVKTAWEFLNQTHPLTSVLKGDRELHVGAAVRIHPKNRADAIDMVLEGKTAFIEAIEEDAERRIHLALVVEDDPGKDLGRARQPGHRFFYNLDEVEPILQEASL
jgi:hydrogenase maturation protease